MTEYAPDAWVVIRIGGRAAAANGPIHKVLGGWHGGYLEGDSWRLNSGITKVERDGDWYVIHGYSGSTYRVHPAAQRTTMLMADVLGRIKEQAEADGSTVEVVGIESLCGKRERQVGKP